MQIEQGGVIFVVLRRNVDLHNRMRTKTEITQEDFTRLLGWLASDADEAARTYEEIRRGLIKFFGFRGCLDAEALADETLNRVAVKLATVEFDGNVKVISYFYAFAAKIYLEDCTERKKIAAKSPQLIARYEEKSRPDEDGGAPSVCLDKCLRSHPPQERQLLLEYYRFEKNEKTARRRELAAAQGINMEYLHTKISRLRKSVGNCLRKCLKGEKLL